jgi:isopropylmalate/homocitrate/citramalate synthase
MSGRVLLYDTTLRDGSQGTGIAFSLADKIDIARRLDRFGFDYVEGGWPGSNPKDEEFFDALKSAPLERARLTAFGSTRRAGTRAELDANLKGLVAAATPAVAIFAKAWDFQVRTALRTTLEENLEMTRDSVGYLKKAGREVVLDAEHFFDGYRADHEYAVAVLAAAAEAGADWLVLCDTNGGTLPDVVAQAVASMVARFEVPIGIHAHNDGELAVANSLAAVGAGARQVQGTHKGGVHVHAVAADARTYEHVDPASVGNERRVLVSELAGRRSIVERARSLGFELEQDSPVAIEVMRRIKELERDGFQFEDALGSFALLVHRCSPSYRPPFQPLAYQIATHKAATDAGSRSCASVEVAVGGEVLRGEAAGGGPVDALEKALRGALIPAYAHLEEVHLVDFRAYVARVREGRRGNIAVRITASAPESPPWTTVGSASDLLHGAWIALTDTLELAVLRDAGPAAAAGDMPRTRRER